MMLDLAPEELLMISFLFIIYALAWLAKIFDIEFKNERVCKILLYITVILLFVWVITTLIVTQS